MYILDFTCAQLDITFSFYSKKLDGYKFTGVGPKICVFFGENGEIIGSYSVWAEVDKYAKYPTIDSQKAIDNILDGKATIVNAGRGDSGSINEIEIIYDMESLRSNQMYIIPYYMVKGKNISGSDFTAYTRAIPEEYISEAYLDDIGMKHYESERNENIPHREDEN